MNPSRNVRMVEKLEIVRVGKVSYVGIPVRVSVRVMGWHLLRCRNGGGVVVVVVRHRTSERTAAGRVVWTLNKRRSWRIVFGGFTVQLY